MRHPIIIGLALLVLLLFLWGRNRQAPIHVSDKGYDLMLSTLLSHSVQEIPVDQLTSRHFHVLDARSYREFEVSHIAGATWVGYEEFDMDRLAGTDKQAPVAVYCSVGYRSERVAEKLREQGYSNVVNVYGGIFEWVNTGHPVVTINGAETNQIHAYSKFWGIWLKRGTQIYQ
jgi:rhodanese-related sulfurtransferase